MGNDDIRIREWERLNYHDPEKDLVGFAYLSNLVFHSSLPPAEKQLRTRPQQGLRERRQAALFAWGVVQKYELQGLEFAMYEAADYDSVFRWREKEGVCYRPVQLKELPSESLNSKVSLDLLLASLKKYTDSNDLTVAVFANRGTSSGTTFEVPAGLAIGGLFLYGSCTPDQTEWFLQGDLMKGESETVRFLHPVPLG